jgi:hypothetical protein
MIQHHGGTTAQVVTVEDLIKDDYKTCPVGNCTFYGNSAERSDHFNIVHLNHECTMDLKGYCNGCAEIAEALSF